MVDVDLYVRERAAKYIAPKRYHILDILDTGYIILLCAEAWSPVKQQMNRANFSWRCMVGGLSRGL